MLDKLRLHTPLVRLIQTHAFASVLDQAIISAANFGTTVIIGRWIGASDLGIYVLIFTVLTFCVAIAESLVSTPMTALIQKLPHGDRPEYLGIVVLFHSGIIVVVALSAGLVLIGSIFFPFLPLAVIVLAAFWIILVLTRELARRYSMAIFRPLKAVFLDALAASIHLGALAAIALLGLSSLPTVFAIACAAHGIGLIVWWLVSGPRINFGLVETGKYLGIHLRLGSANLAALSTFLGQIFIIPWLLVIIGTPAQVGQFAACHALVMLTNPLTQGFANAAMPKAALGFAQSSRTAFRAYIGATTWQLTYLMLPLVLLLLVFGGQAMLILYGADFRDLHGTVAILALSSLVRSAAMAPYVALWAMDKSLTNAIINILGIAVTSGLAIALFDPLGIFGAAIALLAGDTVSGVLRAAMFKREARG